MVAAPARVRLDVMATGRVEAWLEHSVQGLATGLVRSGLAAPRDSLDRARDLVGHLLPLGPATPDQHFRDVRDLTGQPGGTRVGALWMRVAPFGPRTEAFVVDVEIDEAWRGRGQGRATMLAARQEAGRLGASALRLSVFSHNAPALRLYDGLGLTVDARVMTIRLVDDPPAGTRPPASPVRLDPCTDQEYAARRPRLEEVYAAGALGYAAPLPDTVRRRAAEGLDRMLPDGPHTPGHLLWTARAASDGSAVAEAWVQWRNQPGGPLAVCLDLTVAQALRGGGYGGAVLVAVLEQCRALGAAAVQVVAPEADPAARRAARAAGLHEVSRTLTWPVEPDEADPGPASD